jgi:hypothetical protein
MKLKFAVFGLVFMFFAMCMCVPMVMLSATAQSAQQTPIAYDTLGHPIYGGLDCVSKSAPAICANDLTGAVVVAAGATTVVVNDTSVASGSHIIVQEDSSLGTNLGVTCNTTPATAPPTISARVIGTSFTITTTAPTTNPRCFSFHLFS